MSAEAARRALARAEHGDRAMGDTAEAMRRINAAVQQTSGKMHSLGARSNEISEIITLIEEIAAQTNLLRSEKHTSEPQSRAEIYTFPYTTLFRSRAADFGQDAFARGSQQRDQRDHHAHRRDRRADQPA